MNEEGIEEIRGTLKECFTTYKQDGEDGRELNAADGLFAIARAIDRLVDQVERIADQG